MAQIQFQAQELQANGTFQEHRFEFIGNEHEGWRILRNGSESLKLGPGYTLVKTLCCGVCSTDLARHFLPYPLPQVIGHEVVGEWDNTPVVVEINASHKARGLHEAHCLFCQNGMNTQCPERITLGINQLPGGFSPYFLAPVEAIQKVPPSISPLTASFTEPFAAALQGVEATFPKKGDSVAVLGPRRLGMLVLAALQGFRKREGIDFQITGLVRHGHLEAQCRALGADQVIPIGNTPETSLQQQFDIVFDTTGKPEGFELALRLSRRVVHLKSTNGQTILGMQRLTDMVVDEIALLPFGHEHLSFQWPIEPQKRHNRNILITPSVSQEIVDQVKNHHPQGSFHQMEPLAAKQKIQTDASFLANSPFPRFDLAIASHLEEIDQLIRPVPDEEFSPIRARGAILLAPTENLHQTNALTDAIHQRGIQIHSSRCGNFERALKILKDNPEIAHHLESDLVTHTFPLNQLQKAFETASDSKQSIKVVVDANE